MQCLGYSSSLCPWPRFASLPWKKPSFFSGASSSSYLTRLFSSADMVMGRIVGR